MVKNFNISILLIEKKKQENIQKGLRQFENMFNKDT